jgi:SulP family sulfate permease
MGDAGQAVRHALRPVLRLLPRRADYAGLRRSWPRDLAAGVTVGVVALPLALGFGVASGVGPAPGLVTAVIAGAVAAVFGGSSLQVSGPTGAMTVVLVPLVAEHGPGVVYPVAVMAGVLVVAAAVLRLGRLLAFVPWPLVEGFTLGIAVVIAAQQVPAPSASPSRTSRTPWLRRRRWWRSSRRGPTGRCWACWPCRFSWPLRCRGCTGRCRPGC